MKPFLCVLFAVSVWGQSPTLNDSPSRAFGQLRLQTTSGAPNLVEGRELNLPKAIAFDRSVTPPILYVADTNNNRVLAWQNPASLNRGNKADLVIGQRDFFSTQALGPGTTLSSGLAAPISVAVDSSGNLYVMDLGSNRILRYPQPFRQPSGDLLVADLVIGQSSVSQGSQPNQALSSPSAKTLDLRAGGAITFDVAGNLWVADSNNNRVIRFPRSQLAPFTVQPAADLVLGQGGRFDTNAIPQDSGTASGQRNVQALERPFALTFDTAGRLYIADSRARILYFGVADTSFAQPLRVLGINRTQLQGQAPISCPNAYTVAGFTAQCTGVTAFLDAIYTLDNNLFVSDSGSHRVLRFDPPERWLAATDTVPSPAAADVFGQNNFTEGQPNRNQAQPDNSTLRVPSGGAFLDRTLWLADSGNFRVLSFPEVGTLRYGSANRVLGQDDFAYNGPNLVEGRELWLSNGSAAGGAIAIDRNSNPPRLYIADTYNHRILGFRDARVVGVDARATLTQKADLVIGQPDLNSTLPNWGSPNVLANVTSQTGLLRPIGLVVDGNGNLLVADSGNGRVVRFPSPFNQPAGRPQTADLVLGQAGFVVQPLRDVSISSLNTPYGLALFADGSLAVSDTAHNRVMIWRKPAGGDYRRQGDIVLGQQQFDRVDNPAGNGVNQLRNPGHIAVDSSDRLYVMDSGNSRLVVFSQVFLGGNGASSVYQLANFNSPLGIAVSQVTGEIYVADANQGVVYRLPEFDTLRTQTQFNPTRIPAGSPLAVALDSVDNLVVAEAINRVSFYFARLTFQHAASYNQRAVAPGQLTYLYRLGKPFAFSAGDGTAQNPWPTTLSDIQVTVNGIAAPIFRVNPERIDFQVPQAAPTSGQAEFMVQRASTGEILAVANLTMAPSNPGFFTANAAGTGLAAAVNGDGTINSPSNPVARGGIISFYLTGMGRVDGAPPDGAPPSGAVATPVKPRIIISTSALTLPEANVEYSGLGAFAGGWQINIKVPNEVPPSASTGGRTGIVVIFNDTTSNVGTTPNPIEVSFQVK